MRRKAFNILALRNRSTPLHSGYYKRLRNVRKGVFYVKCSRRAKCRSDSRAGIVFYTQLVQLIHLLAHCTVNTWLACVKSHDIKPLFRSIFHCIYYIRQSHILAVINNRILLHIEKKLPVHQRTCVYDNICIF